MPVRKKTAFAITDWIKYLKSKGYNKQQLKQELLRQGFSENDIQKSLTSNFLLSKPFKIPAILIIIVVLLLVGSIFGFVSWHSSYPESVNEKTYGFAQNNVPLARAYNYCDSRIDIPFITSFKHPSFQEYRTSIKDLCYFDVAYHYQSEESCAKLDHSYIQDLCISTVATSLKDSEICKKVESESVRTICILSNDLYYMSISIKEIRDNSIANGLKTCESMVSSNAVCYQEYLSQAINRGENVDIARCQNIFYDEDFFSFSFNEGSWTVEQKIELLETKNKNEKLVKEVKERCVNLSKRDLEAEKELRTLQEQAALKGPSPVTFGVGQTEWMRRNEEIEYLGSKAITENKDIDTYDENIYVISNLGLSNKQYISKYDSDGYLVWTKSYGEITVNVREFENRVYYDRGIQMAVDSTGTYIIGDGPELDEDIFIRKFNHDGNEIWVDRIGNLSTFVRAKDVALSNGDIYFLGMGHLSPIGSLVLPFIRKYDHNGQEVWTKELVHLHEHGQGITANAMTTSSDGIYITGTLGDSSFLAKIDFNGNALWNIHFDSEYRITAKDISVSNDGVYVTGDTWGNLEKGDPRGKDVFDAFAMKFDFEGDLLWQKQIDINGKDYGYRINSFENGAYLYGSNEWGKLFVAKFNSNGEIIWVDQFNGTSINSNFGISKKSGNTFIAGIDIEKGFIRKYS